MEKPDGLVALTPDILKAASSGLVLRDLPGVGARMESACTRHGIRTMPQLLALNREQMNDVWGGIGGEKLWHWLRGEDFNDPELEHQKSISQSHVLPPELRTREGCYAVAHKLLHKAAMRLRTAAPLDHPCLADHQICRAQRPTRERTHYFRHSASRLVAQHFRRSNARTIRRWSKPCEALGQLPTGPQYQKPFFVGVWLGNLVPDHLHTLSLFSGLEAESRRTRLSSTMDALNHKYGTDTLLPAACCSPRPPRPRALPSPAFPTFSSRAAHSGSAYPPRTTSGNSFPTHC